MLKHATSQDERLSMLKQSIHHFSDHAATHDEDGTFPHENIQTLKEIGYPSITVPKEYQGLELSLSDWLPLQTAIAEKDGSTALSIGWHIGIVSQLNEKSWPRDTLSMVFSDIVHNGALLNTAASEPETGSPTRGGKPTTTAKKSNNGWVIHGRKSFTSMSPALDYIIVSATTEDGQVGHFLVRKNDKGVRIDETWNSIAMRATASHDLYLEHVEVPDSHFVETIVPGQKAASGWLLHIPACYLGIAEAAQQEAISFAKTYSPNSLNTPIKDLPNIQTKIGENEAALMQARHFLSSVAKKWDVSSHEERLLMGTELGAVKYHVVNAANQIVDRAMRVVGAQSLFQTNPLQRYYRDVRAGLHNPPMDDRTLLSLAEDAFGR